MIPDSLLIQIEPIRWIGGFSWSDLVIALIITLILSLIYIGWRILSRKIREKQMRKNIIMKLPEQNDLDFLEKCGSILRNYIGLLYLPAKSRAHTAREICHYVNDEGTIETLELIEKYEYSESQIDTASKNKIIDTIEQLERKIRNMR